MSISTVDPVIKPLVAKTLPFVAAAALVYPGVRKLADAAWRDELTTTYQLGDQSIGGWFFVVVGLIELAMAGLLLWPRTRVAAGLAMAGFFVGALVFNLGLRVDQAVLPAGRPGLSTLIVLDVSHLVLGLAVAWSSLRWSPGHGSSRPTLHGAPAADGRHDQETVIHTDDAGYALQGHDAVAYFTVGAPTKGDPNISRAWNGATWLFSTEEHRDLFDADPHRYAPAFGGHCAVAQVFGADLDGSAKRWRIENDRLYINKNLLASSMFGALAGRIRELDRRP